MAKKDLEETLKEKVSPLLEDTMEKHWGITIPKLESDITDKLKQPHLRLYVPTNLGFKDAKKRFKAEFLKSELRLHQGNISELAKFLGIDRRSIHRAIKELDIDLKDVRHQEYTPQQQQEELVRKMIRESLEPYRGLIQPQKMEKVYEEVPRLSRNIAKCLPHQQLTWKQAEREFERQFLGHALREHGALTKTAEKIGLRIETLSRKLKKLGLR